ncbi:MAG: glycosyltransferase family 4 protein [Candidatus Limnocylindrales bacterium]
MRVGIVAARLGEVDGVSFEALKWQAVLTGVGHEVVRCAGALGEARGRLDQVIPEMHLGYAPAARVSADAFDPLSNADEVRATIDQLAGDLLPKLADWVESTAVDVLIIQNAWAIPMQLPLGVALARLVRDTGIATIGHHHDYWWERERFTTCVVPEVLREAFPPNLPGVRHVSINSLAAADLYARRGLESTTVPNVFDFDQPLPEGSERDARRLRAEMGLADTDLLFVQPTRVVPRKGIELAIELVARLNQRLDGARSVLLITSPAGDEGHDYLVELLDLAARLKVDLRYEPERFRPDSARHTGPAHSLADAYIAADVITYPSLYEGFGNALVESVYFRKLTVVNRYSVYEADIRPLGFRFIELLDEVTDEAVDALRQALADPVRMRVDSEHNFALAREHFGYDRLRRDLASLVSRP